MFYRSSPTYFATMRPQSAIAGRIVAGMGQDETEQSYALHLGATITELRIARGFSTQLKFADHVKCSVATVQRWETGGSMPNAWNIRALAEALDVDAGLLLYPPDRLSADILDVSRAAAATVHREMVKRAARRHRDGPTS